MNKKLLAVMIGGALAGSIGVAQADVQLYGQVDASIDSHTCDSGGCPKYGDTSQSGLQKGDGSQKLNMNGNFSYFGIKGAEDLGNGLKAIFNVAFTFDPAGGGGTFTHTTTQNGTFNKGGNTLTDSEKWLGVAGDFGTVRAGTVYSLYKEHGEAIDPFYGTSLSGNQGGLQAPTLTSPTFASDFAIGGLYNRTIRYDSPDMNGLSGGAFYTMGHGTTAPLNGNGNNTGNPYGLGGQYKNDNILAFADYVNGKIDSPQFGLNHPSGAAADDKAWDIGGQYTMGNIAMFGKYESGGLVLLSGYKTAYIWHLGGSFKMGNSLMYAAYGQGDSKNPALSDSKTRSWTLGAKHNLSVRTSLYAGYNWNKAGTNTNPANGPVGDIKDGHFGLGMNVKF